MMKEKGSLSILPATFMLRVKPPLLFRCIQIRAHTIRRLPAHMMPLWLKSTQMVLLSYIPPMWEGIPMITVLRSRWTAPVRRYVIGDTFPDGGGLFPLVNQYQGFPGNITWCGFVLKLNATGTALLYSSYLGGNSSTYTKALAIDSSGNMYLGGNTIATNFPMKNAFDSSSNGNYDAFLSKFDPSQTGASSLIYSTYVGGGGNDWITGIAVDARRKRPILLAVRMTM